MLDLLQVVFFRSSVEIQVHCVSDLLFRLQVQCVSDLLSGYSFAIWTRDGRRCFIQRMKLSVTFICNYKRVGFLLRSRFECRQYSRHCWSSNFSVPYTESIRTYVFLEAKFLSITEQSSERWRLDPASRKERWKLFLPLYQLSQRDFDKKRLYMKH